MKIRGYSPNSHNLILFYGIPPIKQPFGVYESRVDITLIRYRDDSPIHHHSRENDLSQHRWMVLFGKSVDQVNLVGGCC